RASRLSLDAERRDRHSGLRSIAAQGVSMKPQTLVRLRRIRGACPGLAVSCSMIAIVQAVRLALWRDTAIDALLMTFVLAMFIGVEQGEVYFRVRLAKAEIDRDFAKMMLDKLQKAHAVNFEASFGDVNEPVN